MTKRFTFYVQMMLIVLAGFLTVEAQAHTTDEPLVNLRANRVPITEVLAQLEKQTDVIFSYESSQLEKFPAISIHFHQTPLTACIEKLCTILPISYHRIGRFIIIKPKKMKKFTVSGFVRDKLSGESLIGASVVETNLKTGTITNEHGFFSLTLNEGETDLEITYIGYGAYHFHVPYLRRDTTLTANLSLNQQLEEVVINASLDKNQLQSPQIGKVTFNYSDIKRTPVLFGEADIVKVMQTQAGVSPGVAGFSDMYVRGGNKDENLYLIEGSPIYQVNHVAGLFSALNVEAIKGMDFYKAGFPARFGGRISSVVDVKLKDGNLNEYHGSATLGLTSGSLNLEGPIFKGKTAFNFNLRRSWFDVLTAPALAIWNATKSEGKSKTVARYAFTDLNFKLTHHFNTRSRAFAGVYWGKDYLKGGTKEEIEQTKEEDISRLNWGSVTAFGGWAYALSPKLYGTLNASYTHYRSDIRRDLKNQEKDKSTFYRTSTANGIDDVSFRADFSYQPATSHHIRFGGLYTYHKFRPDYDETRSSAGGGILLNDNQEILYAHEAGIYAEDEWNVCPWFIVNGGLRFSLYHAEQQTYTNWEPRINTVFRLSPRLSVKASYARMSQYVHQLNESYIDLPTDSWIPVGREFKPLQNDQLSAGVYFSMTPTYSFAVEGFYKWMNHVLDYKDGYNIFSTTSDWRNKLTAGKGKSYGMELTARKEQGKITGVISYTLSWNNRRFEDINQGEWFPAKFDNRHKVNITANWRVSKKVELNAAWTYMTGNRITVSFDNYYELGRDRYTGWAGTGISPTTPGVQFPGSELVPPDYYFENGLDYYTKRNNVRLPAYHRLDLGINIYKPLKKGRTGIWNVSIYNAYCYMAPASIQKRWKWDENYNVTNVFQTLHLIPIIPSVSYTLKF